MTDSSDYNSNFFKIVYTKITTNGQTELVPLKLYSEVPIEEIALPEVTAPIAKTATGTSIANRYLIHRVLGQGGFGRTYLAYDQHCFNKFCVLKEFLPEAIAENFLQKSRDLFQREARILYQISHPQIPKFLACFEDNGRLFLVQDYVDGKTYSTLLRERLTQQGRGFDEVDIVEWLKHLLPVLAYIHQHGIIHRDISPDNIIFDSDKNLPVLIDFGVGKQEINSSNLANANSTTNPDLAYVRHKSMVGKIGYAPHEQIRLGQCSPSSDLYSLGVTAIVLLTGKGPQELLDRYSLEWHWRDYTHVNPSLAQVLDKMLADRPKDRYQSAPEVLAALESGSATVTISSSAPTATFHSPQTAGRKQSQPLNPAFIKLCHQELTNYIGPIASFLIRETLTQNPEISAHLLVESLAEKIPNPQQAIAFRRRFF